MNTSSHTSTRLSSPWQAFTLVELLVVIAVIIVLVGIGLTVGNSVVRGNEINRTKTTLANALQVATEYEIGVGPVVNHLASVKSPVDWTNDNNNPPKPYNSPTGAAGASYDLDDPATGSMVVMQQDFQDNSIERFVWTTRRVSKLAKLYATFRDEVLRDIDPVQGSEGYLDLVDAWGRKLVYAAYVRAPDPTINDVSDDFLPLHDAYFFASAGPDGKWGHANPDALTNAQADLYKIGSETSEQTRLRLREEAGDNVYTDDTLQVR